MRPRISQAILNCTHFYSVMLNHFHCFSLNQIALGQVVSYVAEQPSGVHLRYALDGVFRAEVEFVVTENCNVDLIV